MIICPHCGYDGATYVDDDSTDSDPIYCPECDELINPIDECYCSKCSWNIDGHCIIPEDQHITLGEDCPYLEE